MSSNPFDPLGLDALLGRQPRAKPAPSDTERGVQIRGKNIDGEFYVRASDVADLLAANDVLPGIAKKLRRKP